MVPAKLGGPWNRVVNGALRRGWFYHPIRPEIDAASRMAPSLWSVRETRAETEKQERLRPDTGGDLRRRNTQFPPPPPPGLHVQPCQRLWLMKVKNKQPEVERWRSGWCHRGKNWSAAVAAARLLFIHPRSARHRVDSSCQQSGLSVVSANERAARQK